MKMKLQSMNLEKFTKQNKERHTITLFDGFGQFNLEICREDWMVMYRYLSKQTTPTVEDKTMTLAKDKELKLTKWIF